MLEALEPRRSRSDIRDIGLVGIRLGPKSVVVIEMGHKSVSGN